MSGKLPVESPTASFWLSSPHRLHSYRSSASTPEECDIAIIGTGMAGVATAYHILGKCAEGPKPKVALFEARQACSGATGRNGGHSKTLLPSIKGYYDRYGPDLAEELVSLVSAQQRAIKSTVERENIECDLFVTRSFDAFFDPAQARNIKTWLEELRRNGAAWTQDIQWLEGPNIERVTGVKGVVAAASSPAFSFWPYKFVTSLLARVLHMGAILYTETPVEAVQGNDNGTVTLVTPRGTTRAQKVIYATNAYSSAVLPQYQGVIVPYRGQNSILVPLEKNHHGLNLAHTCNLFYSSNAVDYLVPRPDGNIVHGGAPHIYRLNSEDRNSKWFNTVDDATLIDEAVKTHFDHTMAKRFRGWEYSDANVAMTWTGIMGSTPDHLPHVGLVPGTQNQWILAGFNGAGMTTIFTTAEGVAEMVLTGKTVEETEVINAFKTTEERIATKFS
ncbi:uncharacterized protein JN550_012364 [Neoarthrinium moseri]|uniref:uncharacterized protein n=1 Tax=Neoarthrinium moseri TaxID=1658444 RepID=UPI001FDE9C7C|nr:uncharacterized protein JN550_012364 [Neoarthrinium moseri]KAI1858905.1 hypothetical protein JN550_012364 [Neoarthrinium moseri]